MEGEVLHPSGSPELALSHLEDSGLGYDQIGGKHGILDEAGLGLEPPSA